MLFRGKWPVKIRHPKRVRHSVGTPADTAFTRTHTHAHMHTHTHAQALRGFYYDLLTDSFGKQLNDGQVSVDRAMFWPALVKQLNPKQPDFRSTFLGIHGGHHWNLALPVSTPASISIYQHTYTHIHIHIYMDPRQSFLESRAACEDVFKYTCIDAYVYTHAYVHVYMYPRRLSLESRVACEYLCTYDHMYTYV